LSVGELMAAAERARRRSHAPYSGFAVGAALLAEDGRVFLGANVENASYGLTVCAERVALWTAVTEGARGFEALAIAGPRGRAAAPCGACRQALVEFAPGLRVAWRGPTGRLRSRPLAELLPEAFRLRRGSGR
jgi:cytidine deaminase